MDANFGRNYAQWRLSTDVTITCKGTESTRADVEQYIDQLIQG